MDTLLRLTSPVCFVTTTVVDWVDVFSRRVYKDIVVESLDYCQREKGLILYAWVLMTNHLHLVVGMKEDMYGGDYDRFSKVLSDTIRDFKKFTSKKIIDEISSNQRESRKEWMLERFRNAGVGDKKIKDYRFWQEGYHSEDVYTMDFLWQKINYVHQNPVGQGLVVRAEDYLYGSAVDYAGGKGLLPVEVVGL